MRVEEGLDFTRGPIARQILSLALPIIGTAFVQMAYNLSDLFWIGREGSLAASAVGAAGIFMWLANSLSYITKVGAEITISQSLGRGEGRMAYRFARHALMLGILIGLMYGIGLYTFGEHLIGFFGLQEENTQVWALGYLRVVALGMVFTFANATYFGLYNGFGNSKVAFIANGSGLLLNVILDPVMIRGLLGCPAMGVSGAAWATVISQGVVTLIFVGVNLRRGALLHRLLRGFRPAGALAGRVVRLGLPVAAQSAAFALIALVIARIVARWGDLGIGVQSVGAQIEALSWMTAAGFSSALGSFVGQNWGSGNRERIVAGYHKTLLFTGTFGLLTTVLCVFFGREVFGLFIPEADAIAEGGVYLRILGYSQLFSVLEITTSGVFNGTGRTVPPAICGVAFNLMRIPLALWWGSYGLSGIWWAIAFSSFMKGVSLWTWLRISPWGRTKHKGGRRGLGLGRRFLAPILPNRSRYTAIETEVELTETDSKEEQHHEE